MALLARRKSMLDDLAGRINAEGGRALAIPCDVTKRSDVDGAIEQATRSFNRLDVLVNSAGILIPAEVEKIKLAEPRAHDERQRLLARSTRFRPRCRPCASRAAAAS